jgi:phosphoglycerol geranylgeranyltransferase
MSLWSQLLSNVGDRTLHATLIDPATSSPSQAGKIAKAAATAGTDVFLLGGSTDVTGNLVGSAVEAIQRVSDLPVVLFPSGSDQFAPGLDGLLFTVTFNSMRPELIIEEQAKGSAPVLASGIDPITTAYVIVKPGMTVGEVAQADLVPRDDSGAKRVGRYAALSQILDLDAIYLEAGSGAPSPVPSQLVNAAKKRDTPVIVGGGIRTPEAATRVAEAGADMIVTGTLAENGDLDQLAELIEAL